MRIDLTLAQVAALEAAAAGKLYRPVRRSPLGLYRIAGGRAVTMSAFRLVDKHLITDGPQLFCGAVPTPITDLGQAVLDELASRGPDPKGPTRP